TSPAPVARGPVCAEGAAVPASLVQPGSVLLFGEIHGAKEIPALFGEAVCSTAAAGTPIEVGLEVPQSERAKVEAFLASDGAAAPVGAVLASPFWNRELQDGRSSQAMAALLDQFRRLGLSGAPVHVFLFDVDDSGTDRDRRMADNLAEHARVHPEAL